MNVVSIALLLLYGVGLSTSMRGVCTYFEDVSVSHRESPQWSREWVALLWITCPHSPLLTVCEGSLVGTQWILTSASCLHCGTNASVVVDIGLHYSDIRKEMAQRRPVQRIAADHVLIHPNFNPPYHHHDLALVHLSISTNISYVISLIECTQFSLAGRSYLSSGWGSYSVYSSLDPKPLQDIHLHLWPKRICTDLATEKTDGIFCAGIAQPNAIPSYSSDWLSTNNGNPCYLNHGSSIVTLVPRVVSGRIVCEWQVHGVLSFGLQCDGSIAYPGFYTDTCSHREWLITTMRDEEEKLMNLRGCPTLPPSPVNGYICGLEDVSSGKVQFCCSRGYKLKGIQTVTCNRKMGKWLPIEGAICEPVACPSLEMPPNALSHPMNCQGRSYSMACWFSCEEGYVLNGQSLLTCLEDGTWSETAPSCEPIDCGAPNAGGNLVVDYSKTTYKSLAYYTCKECYRLNGANTTLVRECDANGHWSGPLPICELVYCPALSSPDYGHVVQSSNKCGSQGRYYCMNDFVLLGDDIAVCQSNGQWSHPLPFCVSSNCPTPVVEDSINFLPPTLDSPPRRNFTYGDTVAIKCQECRRIVGGSSNLTCTQGGKWDGILPLCEWITCILPALLPNGQVFPLGNVYFCGTRVRFRCYPGYELIGASSSYCGQDGMWSHHFPTCRSLNPQNECPQFSVDNGKVHVNYAKVGGMANVSCADSCYELRGHKILRCNHNGQWDKPYPTCQRKTCPSLTAPSNGRIESSGEANCNDVVLFECHRGYLRDGPMTATCMSNGQWNHEPPVCKAIHCPPPPKPKINSKLCGVSYTWDRPDTAYEFGSGFNSSITEMLQYLDEPLPYASSILYCCDSGLRIKDSQSDLLHCTVTGKWDNESPQCLVECLMNHETIDPHLITVNYHGRNSSLSGDVIQFKCADGHVLHGNDHVTCLSNSSWTSFPHCINSACYNICPPAPVPDNGRLVSISNNSYRMYGGISEGTVALYMCQRGFYLHGSVVRRCMHYGEWNGETTMCLQVNSPRSKFILRHPLTKQWIHADNWHYTDTQPVYLACQSTTDVTYPITKVSGPPLDLNNVRINHFQVNNRSSEVLIQALNSKGAQSITGTYMCHTTDQLDNHVNRTIHIHVYDKFCPTPSIVVNGNVIVSANHPGSCYRVICHHGYRLHGNSYRLCQTSGEWSGVPARCVS